MLFQQKHPISKEALLKKASSIDQRIQELEVLSKGLKHVASYHFENPLDCPKFQKIMAKYVAN